MYVFLLKKTANTTRCIANIAVAMDLTLLIFSSLITLNWIQTSHHVSYQLSINDKSASVFPNVTLTNACDTSRINTVFNNKLKSNESYNSIKTELF